MGDRKHRLADCNPRWRTWSGRDENEPADAIMFECPEGHADCHHTIPFTPALDGSVQPVKQTNGAQWQRTGDTFEALSLSPSIRRIPRHADKGAAIAAGCIAEYVTESMLCTCHIFITNGQIIFCSDSR